MYVCFDDKSRFLGDRQYNQEIKPRLYHHWLLRYHLSLHLLFQLFDQISTIFVQSNCICLAEEEEEEEEEEVLPI